ncbi:glucose-1-phosphate adenylyltransferase, partial [Bacillus cereus]|nr:glucose-1-phosphate adenylyltransferase [Bacillus cereus]
FFEPVGPCCPKVIDEAPTRLLMGGVVKYTLRANGCMIEGEVEYSVVSRSVNFGIGSIFRYSFILKKSQIGVNCLIDGVFID